jgi:NAD(P)H dehydrogenase (quinone)
MLGDRLFNRVKESDFIVFDGMSKARDSRKTNWDKYLDIAYRKGFQLFSFIPKLS